MIRKDNGCPCRHNPENERCPCRHTPENEEAMAELTTEILPSPCAGLGASSRGLKWLIDQLNVEELSMLLLDQGTELPPRAEACAAFEEESEVPAAHVVGCAHDRL